MQRDDPWVGTEFDSGGILGVRLLIAGESTYHDAQRSDPSLKPSASNLIRWVLDDWRKAFYTNVYQVCTNRKRRESSLDDVSQFWHSVAFVNYIPTPIGTHPRHRPSESDWRNAAQPFTEVVTELNPQGVLFLGKSLWWWVCHLNIVTSVHDDIGSVPFVKRCNTTATWIKHPSSAFSSDKWRPRIEQLLQHVRNS